MHLSRHFQTKRVSLGECLQQRHPNNLDCLRVIAAFLVLFGHSFTLILSTPQYIFPHDPISAKILSKTPFQEGLPGLGLHIFFFVSGLLVTQSFINNNGRIFSFLKARILRIIPAYLVCILVLSFILGPLLTSLSFSDYIKSPELWTFVELHLTFSGLSGLPGVFTGNPFGSFANGSLWTIPYELQLYGWVLLFGFLRFLRYRSAFFIVFAYLVFLYCNSGKSYLFIDPEIPRLWIFFFLGIISCLYAEKIFLSPTILVISAAFLAITWKTGNPWFDVAGAICICYAILIFGFFKYFKFIDIGRAGDFSYGIYLYAFPVQQTLIYFFKNSLNGWLLVLFATAVTVPVAVISWYLVEKPALRLKASRAGHITAHKT